MGSRNLPTMIFTKDSIKEVNSMVKESIAGLMDHHIKEILLTAADMGKEIGDLQENPEIFTLEGTKMIKNVVTVATFGRMAVSTKGTLKTTSSKI